jgi:hypothetical protein
MKTRAAILLLSCCLLTRCAFGQDKVAVSAAEAACGPRDIRFGVWPDKSQHPTPTPENGKALIYVVQRASGVMKFGADGKWLGALKGGTYLSASVDPGEHHLCTMGHLPLWKGISLHELTAKAGETYYFFVHIVAGGGYNELTLTELDPDEGKELVARAKFSASHPK